MKKFTWRQWVAIPVIWLLFVTLMLACSGCQKKAQVADLASIEARDNTQGIRGDAGEVNRGIDAAVESLKLIPPDVSKALAHIARVRPGLDRIIQRTKMIDANIKKQEAEKRALQQQLEACSQIHPFWLVVAGLACIAAGMIGGTWLMSISPGFVHLRSSTVAVGCIFIGSAIIIPVVQSALSTATKIAVPVGLGIGVVVLVLWLWRRGYLSADRTKGEEK